MYTKKTTENISTTYRLFFENIFFLTICKKMIQYLHSDATYLSAEDIQISIEANHEWFFEDCLQQYQSYYINRENQASLRPSQRHATAK